MLAEDTGVVHGNEVVDVVTIDIDQVSPEERAERIPWATLRLVASGLDCDPVPGAPGG